MAAAPPRASGVPRSLRQVHRARAAKAQLRGLEEPQGRRHRRRPAHPRGGVPDGRRRLRPGVRVDRARQLRRRAARLPRLHRRPQRQGARARQPGRQREPTPRPPRRRSTSAASCRRRTARCDVLKGPYTVAADAGVRAIDVFASADLPSNDIVLNLFRGTTLVAQADTAHVAGAHPLRTGRRRAGRRLLRPGLRLRGRQRAWQRPADLHRHGHARQQRAAGARTWRAGTSSRPTRRSTRSTQDPWNTPSTDTRQEWCWKAEHERRPTATA